MRVISGKAKRLLLETPEGNNVRPTTDRIKETLFNIISDQLYDTSFLDLFSGSGAIGIEALSRGAKKAVFVENNNEAIRCIENNLIHTKLQSQAELLKIDVFTALELLNNSNNKFDIIFMDPPYNKGLEIKALEILNKSNLIHEDTLIIVESDLNIDLNKLQKNSFKVQKIKKYKTNQHIFLCNNGGEYENSSITR